MVRCKFINARTRYTYEGNAILTKFKIDLTIDNCEFINCGNGHDQRIIMHEDASSSLYIKYSTFKFDNIDNSCLAIDMNSPKVTIEECTFIKFEPNVINIKSKTNSRSDSFILHKNTIEDIRGPFINATNMKISPTITNNTFTNCELQSPLIMYEHDVDEISLFGNTFSGISNQASLQGGPVCMQFNRQNGQKFSLKFDSCKFNQNTNNAQNGNGGAFQYGGDQSNSKVSISMSNCEFNGNKATNGRGSALAFNIMYDIEISGCIFTGDQQLRGEYIYIRRMANNNAKLLSEPSQVYRITNCQFDQSNSAQGSFMYISEETINDETPSYDDVELEISSNIFDDKNGNQKFCIESPCGKMTFENNSIIYYNKARSTPALILTKVREALIKDSQFVKVGSNDAAAIKAVQTDSNPGKIELIGCTFDDCHGPKAGCIDIDCKSDNLILKNNTIKNMQPTTTGNCYSISVQTTTSIKTIVFEEWILIDNSCDGLYGGGTGFWFKGPEAAEFIDCIYTNNVARKPSSHRQDQKPNEGDYYPGDGAIQYGFSSDINNIDMSFIRCQFTQNKAVRNGGVLAIQTIKTCSIIIKFQHNQLIYCSKITTS